MSVVSLLQTAFSSRCCRPANPSFFFYFVVVVAYDMTLFCLFVCLIKQSDLLRNVEVSTVRDIVSTLVHTFFLLLFYKSEKSDLPYQFITLSRIFTLFLHIYLNHSL